jgi:hypothetical protein
MSGLVSRRLVRERLAAALSSPDAVAQALGDAKVPAALQSWLARLMLLHGVPFGSLVPHEAMLPPESMRFFHLDMNWIDALVDGALSIGRNQAPPAQRSVAAHVDAAMRPALHAQAKLHTTGMRARALGVAAPAAQMQVVTGFLLRSSVVREFPGLGVTAYAAIAEGSTPLRLLRTERLGPRAEVLLCLVDGVIARVDLHEPPEHLHYGIREYAVAANGTVTASKMVYSFTRKPGAGGDTISFDQQPTNTDLSDCFRAGAPRTMRLADVAAKLKAVNAAEMGFAMTQGVGLVSFRKDGAR